MNFLYVILKNSAIGFTYSVPLSVYGKEIFWKVPNSDLLGTEISNVIFLQPFIFS